MAEPLGWIAGAGAFILRCGDHDVDFAARCLTFGSVHAVVAGPSAATGLSRSVRRAATTLVVDPGVDDSQCDLEGVWGTQREAHVLCPPRLTVVGALTDKELEPLERTVALTDPRPILALVTAAGAVLKPASFADVPIALRLAGADAAALTVTDVDWDHADTAQLDLLLRAIASFRAAGLALLVEHAERIGPALVAAGASGFSSTLPHHRRDHLDVDGPPQLAGYAEPGRWREISNFRSADAGADIVACPHDGCRALAGDRTRGDLREHRAHMADEAARLAIADPVATLLSMRSAPDAYLRACAETVTSVRSAAA